MKKLHLIVLTPKHKEFDEEVDFIQVHTDKYFLGILPGHTSLISDVVVSKFIVKNDGVERFFAIGSGVIYVENDVVKILVGSLEEAHAIDIDRAIKAKERAEARINDSATNSDIDVMRAKRALAKALNRINVASIFSDK